MPELPLAREKADMIHANFPSPYVVFLSSAMSRLRKIPAVLTWHRRVVFFVGALTRWHRYKGLDVLIKSIALLKNAPSTPSLLVVGLCFYDGMDAGGTATTGCPPKRRGSLWKHESPRLQSRREVNVSAVRLMLYDMYTRCDEVMAMTVVPIRLSRQDARRLDLLVRLGLYNSRTEAMRAMIQATADEQLSRYMLNDRVKEALNELLQAEKRHRENPLRITSEKTAAEIVAESRR